MEVERQDDDDDDDDEGNEWKIRTQSTNIVKLGTSVQPGPARTQIDTRVSSWVDGGEWE